MMLTRVLAAFRKPEGGRCGDCVHFAGSPAAIEARVPGITAMGSAWASVRSQDGICTLRDIYLPARAGCDKFTGRAEISGI